MKLIYIFTYSTALLFTFNVFSQSINKKPKDIAFVESCNKFDIADKEVLVGVSHNVFSGKILSSVGTVSLDGIPVPHTRYIVKVISNIKGNLSAAVKVDVLGGIKDGVLFLDSSLTPTNRLKIGSTYLFFTTSSSKNPKNQHLAIVNPCKEHCISNDTSLSYDGLSKIIFDSDIIRTYSIAYKNENIPIEYAKKARNTYRK